MTRVIGRLDDLARRARRDDEQQLADELVRWSLDKNHAWLCEGVQHEQPFLQISPSPANTLSSSHWFRAYPIACAIGCLGSS